jgi:hypothetical protein
MLVVGVDVLCLNTTMTNTIPRAIVCFDCVSLKTSHTKQYVAHVAHCFAVSTVPDDVRAAIRAAGGARRRAHSSLLVRVSLSLSFSVLMMCVTRCVNNQCPPQSDAAQRQRDCEHIDDIDDVDDDVVGSRRCHVVVGRRQG